MNDFPELKGYLVTGLLCATAYYVAGPVGLGAVALIYLLKKR